MRESPPMSIVAELRLPSQQFALGETLRSHPDVRVEFERVVTHSQEWIMPFLWASGPSLEGFDAAIRTDPTVADVTVADRFDGVLLYRVVWSDSVQTKINEIFDRAGALLRAVGQGESWEIVVRFDTREPFGELRQHFEQGDTNFVLERLFSPSKPEHPEFLLTESQRETLALAVQQGYYSVPRQTTLQVLADQLQVSQSAVSERLRRAILTMARQTLDVEPGARAEQ